MPTDQRTRSAEEKDARQKVRNLRNDYATAHTDFILRSMLSGASSDLPSGYGEIGLEFDRALTEYADAVRDATVAALRQTRGGPTPEQAMALWVEANPGCTAHPRGTGAYPPSLYARDFARLILQRFGGGSGLGEQEVRERERKAFRRGWDVYCQRGHGVLPVTVPDGKYEAMLAAEQDREYPAPAPPAAQSVTPSLTLENRIAELEQRVERLTHAMTHETRSPNA